MKKKILILIGVIVIIMIMGQMGKDEFPSIPIPAQSTPSTSSADVVSKGDRVIAIDVREAAGGTYDEAFALTDSVGMEQTGIFLAWEVLEPTPERYDSTYLDIATVYYPPRGIDLDITLAVIDSNHTTFPADLEGKSFDDPEVIERFKKLVDFVIAKTAGLGISSISIGSEYDLLFGTDETQWRQFQTFYGEIALYIKSQRPEIKVATEPTYKGMIDLRTRGYVKDLNEHSDIIGVSFYGMKENGDVDDPKVVHDVFAAVTVLYDKPIFFFQYGYPSSPLLESSEERQAEFIRETFKAWDTYPAHIEMIDFTWLHDHTKRSAKETASGYGISTKKFIAYLATLGLRTSDGEDKLAFKVLQEEAQKRGW